MIALKESFQYILDANSVHEDYQKFYLSVSQTDRNIKSILATYMHLQCLCDVVVESIVYIVMNMSTNIIGASSQPEQSQHVLFADISPMPTYSQFNLTSKDIERFEFSDWFSNRWHNSGSGSRSRGVPNLNAYPQPKWTRGAAGHGGQ